MAATAENSEQISLAFQFVASLCWSLGAALARPATAADFLQFTAALAWCVANIATLWSMRSAREPGQAPPRCAKGDEAGVQLN